MKQDILKCMVQSILIVSVVFLTITACQKLQLETQISGEQILTSANNQSTRNYKDDFDTWYTVLVPFVYNGVAGISFPGGGEGHATHVGNAKTYFNQLAPFDNSPTLPIPVILYFPELGVPASVMINGQLRIINSIVVEKENDQANKDKNSSIWFSLVDGSTIQQPVSPTRIEITGEADIVGGTGKFRNATGRTKLTAYFNPTDTADAHVSQQGWIRY